MIVPVMSTVSLADHSLHVCSRQALLCVRLAVCHVPLVTAVIVFVSNQTVVLFSHFGYSLYPSKVIVNSDLESRNTRTKIVFVDS